jgi:type IV pilus assembly protein PilP
MVMINQEFHTSMLNTKFVYTVYLICVCLFTTGQFTAICFAEDMADSQLEQQETKAAKDVNAANGFTYQLEGRPDPFEPFIRPQVATTAEPDEIIEENRRLTGMQLFEPGQLTLVAVMFAEGEKMAMVEDVTGKGYIIKEDMLIGRRGIVSRITEDQVIITEKAHTRSGKEIVSTVVMRLNKEGD